MELAPGAPHKGRFWIFTFAFRGNSGVTHPMKTPQSILSPIGPSNETDWLGGEPFYQSLKRCGISCSWVRLDRGFICSQFYSAHIDHSRSVDFRDWERKKKQAWASKPSAGFGTSGKAIFLAFLMMVLRVLLFLRDCAVATVTLPR